MAFLRIAFILLIVTLAQNAPADCLRNQYGEKVCGLGACAKDSFGAVKCSKHRGGGAMTDDYGKVKCGVGSCVKDGFGNVYCGDTPFSQATLDGYGKARCGEGSCDRDSYGGVGCVNNGSRETPAKACSAGSESDCS